ncbi:hypothetical protein HY498_02675 [Candidatus Woesearchaeota archaeon]|nr:hypothetical protein [Candidatus Woesearchaeota archaeon]
MIKRDKKGDATILAYVLLITVTIVLAVIVTVYMRGKAKAQSEYISEIVGSKLECDAVAINVYLENNDVYVTNIGSKTIDAEIRYQTNDPDNPFTSRTIDNITPKPFGAITGNFKKSTSVMNRADKVEVIPKVKVGNKKVACVDKKAVVS